MSMTRLNLSASSVKRVLNFYPPFLGAGIRVVDISQDFCQAKVSMPLTWYNRNYVNTHFGGSLYAMTDPFYMLLLLHVLGSEFIVWDKGATIDYKRPGKGTVTAEFVIENDLVKSLRRMKPSEVRIIDLPVNVTDEENNVVVEVVKTEYIRRKGEQDDEEEKATNSWL